MRRKSQKKQQHGATRASWLLTTQANLSLLCISWVYSSSIGGTGIQRTIGRQCSANLESQVPINSRDSSPFVWR